MGLNVAQLVLERARLQAASPAIITHDQIITYGRLGVAVGVMARHLREHGVVPGQVIGVSMAQNPLHVITLLALAQVGAVALPLHVAVPAQRRLLSAQRFGATCIVSGRDEMALPGLPFISIANVSFDGSSIPPDTEIYPVTVDTPFRIAISSGTSGDPKGMIFTHQLMKNRNQRGEPGLTGRSRVIPGDLNFYIGFGPTFRALALGACLVFPRSATPEHLHATVISQAVTHLTLSPAQVSGITGLFAVSVINWPSVVSLRVGGGPMSHALFNTVRTRLTPNVHAGYGSTESGVVAFAAPEVLEQQSACVGHVADWAKVEIVDEDDHPLPAGEIGLLRIRSEDQVSGYLLNDELNRKHFRDGWFYPGDLGRFDEKGWLYIEGRADDQLNIGGLKVNPEDIDAELASHPNVIEAGAFVFPGEEGAEALAIAMVLREGTSLDDIRDHARVKLGPLAPTQYFVVLSLPRTITGKLRRAELSARFSAVDGLPS